MVSSGAVDQESPEPPLVVNGDAGLIAGWSLLAGAVFVIVMLLSHWLNRTPFDWGRAIAFGVVAALAWEIGETVVKAARKGGGR